jgi:hypothetical protein
MKRGSERALGKLMRLFSLKMGKREWPLKVWGGIYTPTHKN